MESHPIPQQFSSYQFRLVGDMTLKQFFQIAGGALISIIIYSLPIIGIIKWPFVIIFALLGVALAFLPLEDRPLERWIIAFFRSVYSPTLFSWKKTEGPQVFFQEEAPLPTEKILYPGGEAKLQEYLNTAPSDRLSGKLEKVESSFLSGLSGLFNTVQPVKVPAVQVQDQVHPLVPTAAPRLVVEETTSQGNVAQVVPITPVSPSTSISGATATSVAKFSVDAAPPNPPTAPNTLTGQVIDQDRHLIEGAIMEIKDAAGRPVRALKSNKLGHFMVVTPLMGGKYEIITEKDGFNFETVSFEATGTIIPPIAISGKKITQT
jgi:hypothetical protein